MSVDPSRVSIVLPQDAPEAPEGVHIRPEYDPQGQDNRVVRYKLPRAQAYVRANRLDGPVFGAERPRRLGIVTAGKAVPDTLAALRLLGIDEAMARALGIGVYKAALVWPLEPERLAAFAADCRELLFVEEKRPVMEDQAKALFYNRDPRPAIVGKRDGEGADAAALGRAHRGGDGGGGDRRPAGDRRRSGFDAQRTARGAAGRAWGATFPPCRGASSARPSSVRAAPTTRRRRFPKGRWRWRG